MIRSYGDFQTRTTCGWSEAVAHVIVIPTNVEESHCLFSLCSGAREQ